MTSARAAAANRRNARRSTGPRTASGKRRAARNALRHGLSIPVFADPVLSKDIAELAERLADGFADPRMRDLAFQVAAAQIDIGRVRHARDALTAKRPAGAPAIESRVSGPCDEIRQLVALDRYERQAMWRRKRATRAWQAALFSSITGAP